MKILASERHWFALVWLHHLLTLLVGGESFVASLLLRTQIFGFYRMFKADYYELSTMFRGEIDWEQEYFLRCTDIGLVTGETFAVLYRVQYFGVLNYVRWS